MQNAVQKRSEDWLRRQLCARLRKQRNERKKSVKRFFGNNARRSVRRRRNGRVSYSSAKKRPRHDNALGLRSDNGCRSSQRGPPTASLRSGDGLVRLCGLIVLRRLRLRSRSSRLLGRPGERERRPDWLVVVLRPLGLRHRLSRHLRRRIRRKTTRDSRLLDREVECGDEVGQGVVEYSSSLLPGLGCCPAIHYLFLFHLIATIDVDRIY